MIQKSLVERAMPGVLAMRPFVTVFAEDRAFNRCTLRPGTNHGQDSFSPETGPGKRPFQVVSNPRLTSCAPGRFSQSIAIRRRCEAVGGVRKFYGRFPRSNDFLAQNGATLCNDSVSILPREIRFCNAVQNSENSLGSIRNPLLYPAGLWAPREAK
jgi:hypothetical protein